MTLEEKCLQVDIERVCGLRSRVSTWLDEFGDDLDGIVFEWPGVTVLIAPGPGWEEPLPGAVVRNARTGEDFVVLSARPRRLRVARG